MILSCDPPRHAFLIHFGKQEYPVDGIKTVECAHDGARVEIALNQESLPPTLGAIHFVRHGFWLPFIDQTREFSTDYFRFHWRRENSRYVFHFSPDPGEIREWNVFPGLAVLVSETSRPVVDGRRRSVLRGFAVDPKILKVEIDVSEFFFEFGAHNLKDVPVTLFMTR
jgi:hypothetical protein